MHHEELEVLEGAIVEVINLRPRSLRGGLLCDLGVAALLRASQRLCARLSGLHDDHAGLLRHELSLLSGSASDSPDLTLFYARLSDASAAAAAAAAVGAGAALAEPPRLPTDVASMAAALEAASAAAASTGPTIAGSVLALTSHPAVEAPLAAAARALEAAFLPDEVYGRYIDLGELFEQWTNLPGVKEPRLEAVLADDPPPMGAGAAAEPWKGVDFTGWLRGLGACHAGLPSKTRRGHAYKRYIAGAARRLLRFFAHKFPLVDHAELVAAWAAEWQGPGAAWKAQVGGEGAAPEPPGASGGSAPPPTALLDLMQYVSAESLLALGTEVCTVQLSARGLKVGGTPAERAARLWSVRGMKPGEYPKKLCAAAPAPQPPAEAPEGAARQPQHQQSSAPGSEGSALLFDDLEVLLAAPRAEAGGSSSAGSASGAPPGASQAVVEAAWQEHMFLQLAQQLDDVIGDTRRRVERRRTKTAVEIAAERQGEEADARAERGAASGSAPGASTAPAAGALGEDVDDEEEAGPVYNPLDLPLDFDGKPIPYWLYKLHGLNLRFPCGICGGEVYRGRRDFDRHFQEARHAAGMKALGIPNTKHFHDITRIEDARARE